MMARLGCLFGVLFLLKKVLFQVQVLNEKEAREAYNAERGIATFVCKYSCKRLVSHKVV